MKINTSEKKTFWLQISSLRTCLIVAVFGIVTGTAQTIDTIKYEKTKKHEVIEGLSSTITGLYVNFYSNFCELFHLSQLSNKQKYENLLCNFEIAIPYKIELDYLGFFTTRDYRAITHPICNGCVYKELYSNDFSGASPEKDKQTWYLQMNLNRHLKNISISDYLFTYNEDVSKVPFHNNLDSLDKLTTPHITTTQNNFIFIICKIGYYFENVRYETFLAGTIGCGYLKNAYFGDDFVAVCRNDFVTLDYSNVCYEPTNCLSPFTKIDVNNLNTNHKSFYLKEDCLSAEITDQNEIQFSTKDNVTIETGNKLFIYNTTESRFGNSSWFFKVPNMSPSKSD